jgi:hypothetical protein
MLTRDRVSVAYADSWLIRFCSYTVCPGIFCHNFSRRILGPLLVGTLYQHASYSKRFKSCGYLNCSLTWMSLLLENSILEKHFASYGLRKSNKLFKISTAISDTQCGSFNYELVTLRRTAESFACYGHKISLKQSIFVFTFSLRGPIFFNSLSGGWSPTGSTRHGGY